MNVRALGNDMNVSVACILYLAKIAPKVTENLNRYDLFACMEEGYGSHNSLTDVLFWLVEQ